MRRLGLLLLAICAGVVAEPDDRSLLIARLDKQRARGELESALEVADAARQRFPNDLSIHTRYQEIRRSLGHEAQVREEYRRRWRKDKSIHSMCLYARLLDGKAAVSEYRRALRIDPVYFWAHYGIGVVFLRMGELDDAAHHLEIAQTLQPREPSPKIRLGQLAEREGDFARALECYELAEGVAPDLPDPLFHQVFALIALDRHPEAEVRAKRLQALASPDAAALGGIARGILCTVRADRASAAEHFGAAVKSSGRFGAHALCFLGDTFADLERHDEARDAYRKAIESDERSVRARLGLGYILYSHRQFEAADEEFALAQKAAARADTRNAAEPLFFRGVIAEERGKLARALRFYLDAKRHDPEAPEFALALGALYERMNQPIRARKAYLEAAELDTADALPCFQAALREAEMKRGADALAHLEEAVKRDAGLVDAYLAAGTICQDLLGKPHEAKAWYERYLARGGDDKRVIAWLTEME